MKQIQVHSFVSTEIYPEFQKINTIDIDDKAFAEGGFGEVYNCLAINGNKLKTPQVIKIFKENISGSADDNLRTIARLQEKFKQLNIELSGQNKSLLKEYPAFIALPQFSFSGYLNGQLVKGFSSDNLSKLGYFEFEKILSDSKLSDKFYSIPIPRRIYFAYQLASAFKVLDDFKYIHADLKPAALFLNLDNQDLAIIDFDSGIITETIHDKPSTWGSPNDWVAPEIWEQQINLKRGSKINVDSFTDRWSVAIGVNYLITGIHPLFYLTELGPGVTKKYFESKQWPDADVNAGYFCKENESYYYQYIAFINSEIPPQIKERMAYTINFGYKTTAARTTYKDWQSVLKSIQLPPSVKYLTASKNQIIAGESLTIAWNIENAVTVEIENYGSFSPIDKKSIRPIKSEILKVKINGYYGEIIEKIDIKVVPAPKFKELKSENHKIKRGSSTTLIWDIENITKAQLIGAENNPITISSHGRQSIKPEQTTTYRFEVTALDSKTIFEQYLTVDVFEEGKITYFNADRQFAFPTIPITLTWEVQNAIKVEIEGLGVFPLTGQTIVKPVVDTSYKLIVTDNFSCFNEVLQIKMLPLPVIDRIMVPIPNIQTHSTINVTVSDFSKVGQSLLQVQNMKLSSYSVNLNSSILRDVPELREIDYQIENLSFFKRLKQIIINIKKEMSNLKNTQYVIKK